MKKILFSLTILLSLVFISCATTKNNTFTKNNTVNYWYVEKEIAPLMETPKLITLYFADNFEDLDSVAFAKSDLSKGRYEDIISWNECVKDLNESNGFFAYKVDGETYWNYYNDCILKRFKTYNHDFMFTYYIDKGYRVYLVAKKHNGKIFSNSFIYYRKNQKS